MPFGRGGPGTPGMPGSNSRTKRMRTSFKHHQLRTMKSYFAINHNPDAKDLKQLSQKTGLPKRVLQVNRPFIPSIRNFAHVFFLYGWLAMLKLSFSQSLLFYRPLKRSAFSSKSSCLIDFGSRNLRYEIYYIFFTT